MNITSYVWDGGERERRANGVDWNQERSPGKSGRSAGDDYLALYYYLLMKGLTPPIPLVWRLPWFWAPKTLSRVQKNPPYFLRLTRAAVGRRSGFGSLSEPLPPPGRWTDLHLRARLWTQEYPGVSDKWSRKLISRHGTKQVAKYLLVASWCSDTQREQRQGAWLMEKGVAPWHVAAQPK